MDHIHIYIYMPECLTGDTSRDRTCVTSRDVATHLASHRRHIFGYGVATISRRLKITGLFCKRAL